MNISVSMIAGCLIAASLTPGVTHAATISGQDSWETTLQGRDLDGDAASFEAYYDTVLNITWLADANYGAGSAYDDVANPAFGGSTTDGKMTWAAAKAWAAQLSIHDAINNRTYNDWRLPTVINTGDTNCVQTYAGGNCGFNVDTSNSEMAHLFYEVLGNKAYYDATGAGPQTGWGLTNVGPFANLMSASYWSDSEYAFNTNYAWGFYFNDGTQFVGAKTANGFYALAVHQGDVAAIPEPGTWAMLLAGLGLVGAATKRRRSLSPSQKA